MISAMRLSVTVSVDWQTPFWVFITITIVFSIKVNKLLSSFVVHIIYMCVYIYVCVHVCIFIVMHTYKYTNKHEYLQVYW